MTQTNAKGGFAPTESFAIHCERLKRDGAGFDQLIRARIERGGTVPAYDYIDMMLARSRLVRAMDERMTGFDALVLPTVPIVAPKTAEVAAPDEFGRKNAMLLRNTSMINFFDLCAISLPLPRDGGLSTGLMLVGRNGSDAKLFRIATAVERLMAG
jgi:aspartyl-tRNA(Asn)/glutamyl-tRNA(Gln) amidotransferase subunit A